LLENKSYYREGVALRKNQSFAFEFLCENFQPKLINSYSNFKRFFHFLLCDLGNNLIFHFLSSFFTIFFDRVGNSVSSTQGRVELRLGFSENFRFRFGLGFCSTGLGWVSVFIFQKTRLSVGFCVFSKLKKKMEIFINSSNLLQSIGLQWWEKPWFHQKSTKIFDGQPLQHKIVRLLNAGSRTDMTDFWQVGPNSVDDGF
jgi:hypothetical protein